MEPAMDVGSEVSTFKGWQDYPANLTTYNPFTTDGDSLNARLSELSPKLFCKPFGPIEVDIFEISGESGSLYFCMSENPRYSCFRFGAPMRN